MCIKTTYVCSEECEQTENNTGKKEKKKVCLLFASPVLAKNLQTGKINEAKGNLPPYE